VLKQHNFKRYIMTIEVTDANFEEIVLQSNKPVLVDFWAEWCGPCRMIGPLVSELANDYKDRAVITKMDVDSNPGTAARFGIRNIPTILFFKGGDIADKQVGAVPKTILAAKIDALL
jgi:thioredoxin 1